jgi:hypothetical protein
MKTADFIQESTRAPNIGLLSVIRRFNLLRRHIVRRPNVRRSVYTVLPENPGQAKIAKLQIHIPVKKHVLGLDVSVNNLPLGTVMTGI